MKEEEIRAKIIQDFRPWGNFKRYAHNEQCTVKIITVEPHQMLSKQAHRNRDELWVVLDEGLRIELDDRIIEPKVGDEIVILRNTKHRLAATNNRARVLEISFGYADEDDIIRFDDIYGRK